MLKPTLLLLSTVPLIHVKWLSGVELHPLPPHAHTCTCGGTRAYFLRPTPTFCAPRLLFAPHARHQQGPFWLVKEDIIISFGPPEWNED
jgi:hypothetical protein